jgi:hypothetical protein
MCPLPRPGSYVPVVIMHAHSQKIGNQIVSKKSMGARKLNKANKLFRILSWNKRISLQTIGSEHNTNIK